MPRADLNPQQRDIILALPGGLLVHIDYARCLLKSLELALLQDALLLDALLLGAHHLPNVAHHLPNAAHAHQVLNSTGVISDLGVCHLALVIVRDVAALELLVYLRRHVDAAGVPQTVHTVPHHGLVSLVVISLLCPQNPRLLY